MSNILQNLIQDLLKNDIDNCYQRHLNFLSKKNHQLKQWETSLKIGKIDDNVLEALKIVVNAGIESQIIQKYSSFNKDAGLINKIMLKSLKIAQKILAVLLLQSPFKIGIAYNAMQNVIKFLQKQMKTKLVKLKKK